MKKKILVGLGLLVTAAALDWLILEALEREAEFNETREAYYACQRYGGGEECEGIYKNND